MQRRITGFLSIKIVLDHDNTIAYYFYCFKQYAEKEIEQMFRFFQSAGFGACYLNDFNKRYTDIGPSFEDRQQALLYDRYGASHILKPIHDQDPDAFFTVCDDHVLQVRWADENGLKTNDLSDILLAQIEEHRTEIFYNLDPIGFPSSFVRQLSASVKKKIAWRAAPSGKVDFSAYNAIVSNFDSLNKNWESSGWKTLRFHPSWDPETALFSQNTEKETDVFFAGSYARTTGHDDRLEFLNDISDLRNDYQLDLRLLYRKWGRLADRSVMRWIPVPIKLPKKLKSMIGKPVFGREMYQALSNAKIVLNPATDIAGMERGNMRCWETLGCGACMLASEGNYPVGFKPGVNFETFSDPIDLKKKIISLLADEPRRLAIAAAGSKMLSTKWTKEQQWIDFEKIVSAI